MWLSELNKRKLLALICGAGIAAGLSACGFTPVYGPGGSGAVLQGNVAFQAPERIQTQRDENAYYLVRNLETRLGRPRGEAAFQLDLGLSTREVGQAITAEGAITRYSILGRADYTAVRRSDGEVVASGTVENFTGYSATGSTVQALASEGDAHERLMVMLADQIVTRLEATVIAGADPMVDPAIVTSASQ